METITFHLYSKSNEVYQYTYYDPINVTFYDSPNQNHSIANFTIPAFSREECSWVDRMGTTNITGLDLEGAKREIATNGFKVFSVRVEASLRYEFYWFWKTKRYGYRRGADVKVSDLGNANFELRTWLRVVIILVVIL